MRMREDSVFGGVSEKVEKDTVNRMHESDGVSYVSAVMQTATSFQLLEHHLHCSMSLYQGCVCRSTRPAPSFVAVAQLLQYTIDPLS